MVAVYSNIQTLPSCQVFRITHRETTVDGVVLEPAGYLSEPSSTAAPMFKPELYTHQIASGELLYAMVFKPHSFCLGKKYPTVVNVYGGPEVQLVSNTFKVNHSLMILFVLHKELGPQLRFYILGYETTTYAYARRTRLLCCCH